MDIVVSANNNQEILIFPVVPKGEIEISNPQENQQISTINAGALNLIGPMGLRKFSIASIFPVNDYPWVKRGSKNGWEYVDFFDRWRKARVPIRIVVSKKDGSEFLNMPCSIDNFTYSEMKSGDIKYTLELTEFPFVKVV